MENSPLMSIYKPNIDPFTNYFQIKVAFYTDSLYVNVPSYLWGGLSQVFTSRDFIFVVSMKSKADGGTGVMDICDEHGIPEELIYDNAKEESMPGTMIQRIMRSFYIV